MKLEEYNAKNLKLNQFVDIEIDNANFIVAKTETVQGFHTST